MVIPTERTIKTETGVTITWDNTSLIRFQNEDGELVVSIDPTDLSNLYGAYQQMQREEDEKQYN